MVPTIKARKWVCLQEELWVWLLGQEGILGDKFSGTLCWPKQLIPKGVVTFLLLKLSSTGTCSILPFLPFSRCGVPWDPSHFLSQLLIFALPSYWTPEAAPQKWWKSLNLRPSSFGVGVEGRWCWGCLFVNTGYSSRYVTQHACLGSSSSLWETGSTTFSVLLFVTLPLLSLPPAKDVTVQSVLGVRFQDPQT